MASIRTAMAAIGTAALCLCSQVRGDGVVWSPDSRDIAVVDHRQREEWLYLVVVEASGGKSEHKLEWQEKAQDWPPEMDFRVRWAGNQIIVEHGGSTQTVEMPR